MEEYVLGLPPSNDLSHGEDEVFSDHHTTPDEGDVSPDYVEEEDEDDEDEVFMVHGGRTKKKTPMVLLSGKVEKELAEWLQEHPYLYNKGVTGFKNKAKKNRVLQKKAASLVPPLTAHQLAQWLTSMRTRYGKLTKETNGKALTKDYTERERWILKVFHFLGKHIRRQRKNKRKSWQSEFTEVAAAPPIAPAATLVPAASAGPVALLIRPLGGGPQKENDEVMPVTVDKRPATQPKETTDEEQIKGFLENMVGQATGMRQLLAEKMNINPAEKYWLDFFKSLVNDCTSITQHYNPYLKMEMTALVAGVAKLAKAGRTDVPPEVFPHVRNFFSLPAPVAPSTSGFTVPQPTPEVSTPPPPPISLGIPAAGTSFVPDQVYLMTGKQLTMMQQLQQRSLTSTPQNGSEPNLSLPNNSILNKLVSPAEPDPPQPPSKHPGAKD